MTKYNSSFLLSILFMGCGEELPLDTTKEPSAEPSTEVTSDVDGDGITVEDGDCDDTNPNISPSATDLVGDEIDQNCDGVDGIDGDGDGYPSEVSGGDDTIGVGGGTGLKLDPKDKKPKPKRLFTGVLCLAPVAAEVQTEAVKLEKEKRYFETDDVETTIMFSHIMKKT